MLNQKQVEKIFTKLAEVIKEPKTELEYINHFTLAMAVILSAQSTDKMVNKITRNLFKLVKTPADLLKMGEEKLKQHISSIGLFNTKAKNLMKLAEILVRDYDSKIPGDMKTLESLPGIGRKSANVILNVLFNQPTIGVDTHIFRVANRIGLANAKNVLQTELQLLKIVPKKWLMDAHHLLVLHGRYTCKARKPECERCVISEECDYVKLI